MKHKIHSTQYVFSIRKAIFCAKLGILFISLGVSFIIFHILALPTDYIHDGIYEDLSEVIPSRPEGAEDAVDKYVAEQIYRLYNSSEPYEPPEDPKVQKWVEQLNENFKPVRALQLKTSAQESRDSTVDWLSGLLFFVIGLQMFAVKQMNDWNYLSSKNAQDTYGEIMKVETNHIVVMMVLNIFCIFSLWPLVLLTDISARFGVIGAVMNNQLINIFTIFSIDIPLVLIRNVLFTLASFSLFASISFAAINFIFMAKVVMSKENFSQRTKEDGIERGLE